jgi:alpha-tubulin suppressor-like RCC1 family protein
MRKHCKKTTLLILLALGFCLATPLFAAATTPKQAAAAVEGWLKSQANHLGTPLGRVKSVKAFKEDGSTVYYVVKLASSGFVIVAADDWCEPIVAFAPAGTYDPSTKNPLGALASRDLHNRVKHARQAYADYQKTLKDKNNVQAQAAPNPCAEKWLKLQGLASSTNSSVGARGVASVTSVWVAPLTQTLWSQSNVNNGACYNYYTPPGPAGSTSDDVCGCVATAMAQLMRFHQFPTSGVGTAAHTIYVNGTAQTAHLRGGNGSGGPYDWADMIDNPNTTSTVVEQEAIGALCSDAGVAVSMQYTADESGAYTADAATALTATFGYSNAIYNYNYSDLAGTVLYNMVNTNLDAGYPVLFGIVDPNAGGHEIVCDGYGYDSTTLYHHLNLGWAGMDTAWYNLPNIDASPYDFTILDECIYNVYVTGKGEIVSGCVTDANGNPISGAQVAATSSSHTYTATTNSNGIYALPNLPSNTQYTISVTQPNSSNQYSSQIVSTGTSVTNSSASGNLWGVNFQCTNVVPAPTFSPVAGKYKGTQSVTLSCGVSGAAIYYTTDGSSPVTSSTRALYSTPVTVASNLTINAYATKSGLTASSVGSAAYTIIPATPTFNPPAGIYASAQSVTISCATSGTTIYYTTDGSTPTTSSTQYTGAISVGSFMAINAIAVNSVLGSSVVATAIYGVGNYGEQAWGLNCYGQLGNATDNNSLVPGQINLSGAASLAGGGFHSLALLNNGTVWAWGHNSNGQLGNGSTTDSAVPVQVSGLSGITAVAAGTYHSLALKNDGTIWAWGAGSYGQLGNGINADSSTPVQVTGLSGAMVAIAASGYGGLALKSDGTVWTWGDNTFGELGNGNFNSSNTAVQVASLSGVSAIAAGCSHNLALQNGTVWAWGCDSNCQLGNNSYDNSSLPAQVGSLSGVVAIGAGYYHSLALKSDGTVWAWGMNTYGALGNNTTTDSAAPVQASGLSNALALAGGYYHSMALCAGGSVWVWGYNNMGQLGNGSLNDSHVPVQVSGITCAFAIACGGYHSLASSLSSGSAATPIFNPPAGTYIGSQSVVISCVTNGATIYYTTDGSSPVTSSTRALYSTPITVAGSLTVNAYATKSGLTASTVSSAAYTILSATPTFNPPGGVFASAQSVTISCATSGTTIYYTTDGSTPTTSSSQYSGAISVSTSMTIKAIATKSGLNSSAVGYAIYGVGSYCAQTWGSNDFGQLGNGTTTNRLVPGQINLTNTTAIAAGGGLHSLALQNNGTVWAWGYNACGQLGNDSFADSDVPVQVSGLTGIIAISAGGYHSLALKDDGTLWAWGDNYNGQLGNGTNSDSCVPVQVIGLSGNIVDIVASSNNSMALMNDGTVWTWGYNTFGELGNGTYNDSNTPVQVIGLSNISAIAAVGWSNLALQNGTVWAWGWNANGQLGDNSTNTVTMPVQVVNLSGVTAIAAGFCHSLALKSDGSVWAWGYNQNGQLGNNSVMDSSVPVQVSGLSNVISLSGGSAHSMALAANETVWAWGYNSTGQLGDGTSNDSHVPVQVSGLTGAVAIACGAFNSMALAPLGAAAATPTFSPAAGTYTSIQTATISCATSGATIYYTTDGSTPTTSSTKYTAPLTVASTTTINALATATGVHNSSVATATYTINLPSVATPTFSPAAGTYTGVQQATISCATSGATIYYTIDGSTPTTSSKVYSAPLSILTTTLKAIATKTGMANSAAASAAYNQSSTPQVIDDSSTSGFSTTGAWTSATASGYLGNIHYAAASSTTSATATATWTFNTTSGTHYQVAATWNANTNRATNAPYSINNSTAIQVNQQQAPSDFIAYGAYWKLMGTYVATSSTLPVKLANNANGYVIADAVMIVPVPDIPVAQSQNVSLLENVAKSILLTATDPLNASLTYSIISAPAHGSLTGSPPNVIYTPTSNYTGADGFTFAASNGSSTSSPAAISLIVGTAAIIDDSQYGFATTGAWTPTTVAGYLGNFHYAAASSSSATATATWTFNVISGTNYQVWATWYPASNRATNAPYSFNGGTPLLINQQAVPVGLNSNGANWQLLGTYAASSASLVVKLTNAANGYVIADAIMITPVSDIPVAQNQSVSMLENIPQSVTLSGTDPLGAALTYSIVSQPTHGTLGTLNSKVVVYTPNANYTGTDLFTFQVYNGSSYSTNPGTVTLAVGTSFIIDDSSSTGFNTTGAWVATTAGGYLGNIHYAAASSTSSATATAMWTFNVTSGSHYQVAATWFANTNRATNAPYSVNGGTAVLVNQQSAPSGLNSNGATWQILGTYTATGNTLVVKLSNNANGYVIADAVMITITQDIPVAQNQTVPVSAGIPQSITLAATDPWGTPLTYSIATQPTNGSLGTPSSNVVVYTPNANYIGNDSFTFQAYNGANYSASAGTVALNIISSSIIDDSSASGFSTTGTWTAVNAVGAYLGNHHYATASSGSATATATWTFNVTQGLHYQVAATWLANTNRATNAPYSVNGGTPVLVNQHAAPSGLSSNGATWQVLGTYTATGNTLVVTLSNNANGYVIADAVLITASPDIPVAQNQNMTVMAGIAQSITLTATDPWGTSLSYSIVSQPSHGSLGTLNSNVVVYTPNANYTGNDSFTFQAFNGANYCASAGTVSLAINNSFIIDDSSASGFSTTGTWTAATVAGAYLGNHHYAASGNGSASATAAWTFNVSSGGSYQVAVTWLANTNRATNAPFSVNGGTPVLVNQQTAPAGLSSNSATWQVLGTYTATGNTLVVTLSNNANGYVIADAVMIQPPAAVVATPVFSPAAGSYTAAQSVTISCATSGAAIYYTTNGSAPTTASTLYSAPIPVAVSMTLKAIAIDSCVFSSVASATYAINSSSLIMGWGEDGFGQLGNGTVTNNVDAPVQATGVTSITALAVGWGHTLALKTDGTVWAWGYNAWGQLGNNSTTNSSAPVQVSGLSSVIAITAGEGSSMALKSDGTVWAWGDNYYGELGNGSNTSSRVPVQVSGLTGIVAVSYGQVEGIALKNDGTLWKWGEGIPAFTSNVPVQAASGFTGVTAISAGNGHILLLRNNGTVWAWGLNYFGALGNGTNTDSNVPVQASGLSNIVAIAAPTCGFQSLALKGDGTVWSWGYNNDGELGNGSTTATNIPAEISGLSGISAVAAGASFSLALKNDGTVHTWGDNSSGELGNGSLTNSLVPVQVSGLSGVTSIASGGFHAMTLASPASIKITLSDDQNGIQIYSPAVATPNPAAVGAAIAFNISASGAEGTMLSYAWDFGDGQISAGAAATHTYAAAGTYTATATVTDGQGFAAISSIKVTVGD